MDNLTNLLNSKFVLTPKMRANIQRSYLQDIFSTNPNLRVIPPMAAASASKIDFNSMENFNTLLDISTELRAPYPPPERLLCANLQVAIGKVCDKSGNMTCSQCKLVSYCSKVRCLTGSSFAILIFLLSCYRNAKSFTGASISEVGPSSIPSMYISHSLTFLPVRLQKHPHVGGLAPWLGHRRPSSLFHKPYFRNHFFDV
jgi:hypothetical protein